MQVFQQTPGRQKTANNFPLEMIGRVTNRGEFITATGVRFPASFGRPWLNKAGGKRIRVSLEINSKSYSGVITDPTRVRIKRINSGS